MENLHTCIPALWFGCILIRYCLNIESLLSHRNFEVIRCINLLSTLLADYLQAKTKRRDICFHSYRENGKTVTVLRSVW